ncbi:formyltransferase family protein [Hymenobacter terricola]|uniref:formyltransferase family protein n=1 Tax=Hymenobacter terricola TaxID=2819236 RepID=UPI001B314722|nr:formyltransferase family protein [Hymenobacter terricola]
MKIILCGYNWVGCKALDLLISSGHEVFVYTHSSQYYTNDLESFCKKKGVAYTLEKIDEANLPFLPEVIASIYYRYIISKSVIDACNGKIFNLHPSLLPEYKGCSSLTWAMIDGLNTSGYTYHYLTTEVDKGKIIIQKEVAIEDFDTQVSLYYRVMFDAVKDFLNVVDLVNRGFEGLEQDKDQGKYFKRGAPYQGAIDPGWELEKKERFIRAMIFPPLPLATFNGKPVANLSDIQGADK